jgi:putative Mg2+ transporter-C (MgtC) family protein
LPELLTQATNDATLLLRLAVSLLLSAAIGWERERRNRTAGLRTHMLVAVASTLFVGLGEPLISHLSPSLDGQMTFDPTRLIHAVAVGVGFLGAGAIFVSGQDRVRGLTTAASIWATSAVGVAVALNRWVLAVGTTILVLVVLAAIRTMEERLADDDE